MPGLIGPHPGELAVRKLLHVPPDSLTSNPQSAGLPSAYASRASRSPLLAIGTLDAQGRPWTSLWSDSGRRGFIAPRGRHLLGVHVADSGFDPVARALRAEQDVPETVQGVDVVKVADKVVAALAVDLETRDRVKLAGRIVARVAAEWCLQVEESLGNCPKYINRRTVVPSEGGGPGEEETTLPLSKDALALLAKADMFFMSSTDGTTMDTNHRGGPAGFIRVERNDGEVSLVYPEYSGNRLYQTLGNLNLNPLVGIVVPDFDNSDVLYLTGTTTLLVGEAASSVIARSQVAVRITVSEAHYVRSGLSFKGLAVDPSPYNPPVRRLKAEREEPITLPVRAMATLKNRETLTPTIARFTFALDEGGPWTAGQHVTMDFSGELDDGWSHMADDDPQSLNDDLVRTFTVSSSPGDGREFQITARRHGPVTGLLWRQNLRVPLEVPVLGFGGEGVAVDGGEMVFIAGGVGITPFLAQGLRERVRVLWSLRGEDLAFVRDVFERVEGMAAVTSVFVTGETEGLDLEAIRGLGARVEARRMDESVVRGLKGGGRRFFLCASKGLLGKLNGWLDGERVVWEDFGY